MKTEGPSCSSLGGGLGPPKIHLGSGFQDHSNAYRFSELGSFPAFAVGAGAERGQPLQLIRRPLRLGRGGRARPPQRFVQRTVLRPFCQTRGPRPARPGRKIRPPAGPCQRPGPELRQAMRSCSPSRLGAPGEERVLGLCFETSGVRSHRPTLVSRALRGPSPKPSLSLSATGKQTELRPGKGRRGAAPAFRVIEFLSCRPISVLWNLGWQRRQGLPRPPSTC